MIARKEKLREDARSDYLQTKCCENQKTPKSANRSNEEEMMETERGREQVNNMQVELVTERSMSNPEFKIDQNQPEMIKNRK